jgi:TRAP-type mannitol/chloroaromatic compound transport system permease small subunit
MPDLQFVLPHWLYWSGLLGFPLIAMVLVRRQRQRPPTQAVNLPIGYLLLASAGFVGFHRFYMGSWKGIFYVPLFLGILLCNGQARDAREVVSLADSDVAVAHFDVEIAEEDVAADPADAAVAARLGAAIAEAEASRNRLQTASADHQRWLSTASYLALLIVALMLVDAVLLPRLVRRCNENETLSAISEPMQPAETTAPGASSPRLARIIETLETPSRYSGEFVAYWAVIAVFAYYYEVIARYIFNSPTNWVHEGMFLMFGMMFLISGAYALRSNSHVRVDIFYSRFSARGKALIDLSTSIFFFIFAGTLLVTGWTFFSDSFEVREVSFTEWAIQYYPVKTTIVIGAVLILLQGIAKMLADLSIVLRPADKMTAN